MDNSIRSKALKISHQIKSWFSNWGEAQKAGWILAKLQNGISVNFEFAKSEGEVRKAKAIAIGGLGTIAKGFVRFLEMVEDKTQWRSFRLERLVF